MQASNYEYFCSNPCAGEYARAVVRELRKRNALKPQTLKGAIR